MAQFPDSTENRQNLISWFLTTTGPKHQPMTRLPPGFNQLDKSSRSLVQTRLIELKASEERKELSGDERFRVTRTSLSLPHGHWGYFPHAIRSQKVNMDSCTAKH